MQMPYKLMAKRAKIWPTRSVSYDEAYINIWKTDTS